uniref:CSON003669 protein n=1 Tax=Culicoides sonorensis TaxID=179676 RepID=A0A336LIX5_CULSO
MWPVFDRCSSSRIENSSQQETLEHISTIAGSVAESLGSISHGAEEPIYDTDHTDLNSDYDEAELRKELLKDKLRILFDSIDPEGFGEIPVDDFISALKTPELQDKVPFNKQELLYERAMKAKKGPGTVSFQDFVEVVSNLFIELFHYTE